MNDLPKPTYLPVSDNMAESLNNLCEVVNDWAGKKGWNEPLDSISHKMEQLMLMTTELAECAEFIRTKTKCPKCGGKNTVLFEDRGAASLWACQGECESAHRGNTFVASSFIPDDHIPSISGESAELADVLIRIFHYCGKRGINLGRAVQLKHTYNTTRPYRHGKNC